MVEIRRESRVKRVADKERNKKKELALERYEKIKKEYEELMAEVEDNGKEEKS